MRTDASEFGVGGISPQQKLLQPLVDNIAKLRIPTCSSLERIGSQGLAKHNMYREGGYVILETGSKSNPQMSSKHEGPYRVIAHDVQVCKLITDAIMSIVFMPWNSVILMLIFDPSSMARAYLRLLDQS